MTDEIEQVEVFEPTPVEQWPKKTAPLELTLPSGAKARIRRPATTLLLRTGQVPPRLRAAIAKASKEQLQADPLAALGDASSLALDWMVAASFVEPQVTMQRKKGCLYIDDLDEADKDFVIAELDLKM